MEKNRVGAYVFYSIYDIKKIEQYKYFKICRREIKDKGKPN